MSGASENRLNSNFPLNLPKSLWTSCGCQQNQNLLGLSFLFLLQRQAVLLYYNGNAVPCCCSAIPLLRRSLHHYHRRHRPFMLSLHTQYYIIIILLYKKKEESREMFQFSLNFTPPPFLPPQSMVQCGILLCVQLRPNIFPLNYRRYEGTCFRLVRGKIDVSLKI